LPNAAKPTGFDQAESIPKACQDLALQHPQAAMRTLTQPAKISDVLASDVQAFTNERLVDQNGQNTWYDVKLNRVYFDYVFSNQFFNINNQPKSISFPASSNTTREHGTLKVKAAWKVMGGQNSNQPDDVEKFYTTDALIFNKTQNTCAKQTMGLVGLHVVMKTEQLPQWMWATFEHVKNAPTQGETPTGKYNFFNVNCKNCTQNSPPSTTTDNTPTQVLRVVPINSNADSANSTFQAALKTLRVGNVWANYQLVDAQWGESATPLGEPNQPDFLANTTIETYLQTSTPPNGCINCHGTMAGDTDLDFQLLKASSP
jgi:hypothetical protein